MKRITTTLIVLFLFFQIVARGVTGSHLNTEQLRSLIETARAADERDYEISDRLATVELTERLGPDVLARFSADLGPHSQNALRIIAAASEFQNSPANVVGGVPPPTIAQQNALLDLARRYIADHLHSLPDFICTKTTRRYDDASGVGSTFFRTAGVHPRDITSNELGYVQGHESDEPSIIDRPTSCDIPSGLTSYGEFGTMLATIFARESDSNGKWIRWESVNGQRTAVFRYSVDNAQSTYTVTWCCEKQAGLNIPREVKAAYHGEIFVDPESGAILRVTRHADLPLSFPTRRTDTMVEYRKISIDGKPYICPARSVIVSEARYGKAGTALINHYLSEIEFTNYHKFLASSDLRFEEPTVSEQASSVPRALPDSHPASGKAPQPLCPNESFATNANKPATGGRAAPAAAPSGEKPLSYRLRQVRFSPDGKYLLAQDDAVIAVLSVRPFAVLFQIPAEGATPAQFDQASKQVFFIGPVTQIDRNLVALAKLPANLERWDIASQSRVQLTPVPVPLYGSDKLSPNGQVLACDGLDGVLRLVDALSGETIFEWKQFNKPISAPLESRKAPPPPVWSDPSIARLEFSPDGRFFVASPGDEGPPVAWDVREKKSVDLNWSLKNALNLNPSGFAFLTPEWALIGNLRFKRERLISYAALAKFPPAEVIAQSELPPGEVSRAADSDFVLIRQADGIGAFELKTGQMVAYSQSAVDVFGDTYVAQAFNGELGLFERAKKDRPETVVAKLWGVRPSLLSYDHSRSSDASATPVPENAAMTSGEAFLTEARRVAFQGTGALPDFQCRERVTRLLSKEASRTKWRMMDGVSADVVWRDGHEEYRNIAIDGELGDPAKAGTGAWSIGELGSVLADILAPGGGTHFTERGEATLKKSDAVLFSFSIGREHARWSVTSQGHSIQPPRRGFIWFDLETKRVLRIEFRGVEIPQDFPTDTMELALDYASVKIGEHSYVLPAHAELLGCVRDESWCTKNRIEFSDFRGLETDSKVEPGKQVPSSAREDHRK